MLQLLGQPDVITKPFRAEQG